MSAPHSNSHSASSNSNDVSDLPFAPTLRKILIVMGFGFAVPIILLLLIAFYIGSSSEPPAGSESLSTAAVDARVAQVGSAAVAASSQAAAQANAASMATVAAAAPAASAAATPAGSGSGAAMPVAATKVDGKGLYESTCIACHGAGVAGAPKVGDKAAWAPIIAQGDAVLYDRAIHGYTGKHGMMPPKGGSTASDDDVKAAVDYMVAQSK